MEDQTKITDTSPTFFSAWRPLIGWISVVGLAFQFIVIPVLETFTPLHPPHMDLSALVTLITGVLGLGGMRTIEKLNGVASK